MVLEVNRDNFEDEVLGSKGIVVIDFWGAQCAPCVALLPVVEMIERDFSNNLKMVKIDAPHNRMLCAKLKVSKLPTFLFYKNGVEVNRLVGEKITKNDLVAAIKATSM